MALLSSSIYRLLKTGSYPFPQNLFKINLADNSSTSASTSMIHKSVGRFHWKSRRVYFQICLNRVRLAGSRSSCAAPSDLLLKIYSFVSPFSRKIMGEFVAGNIQVKRGRVSIIFCGKLLDLKAENGSSDRIKNMLTIFKEVTVSDLPYSIAASSARRRSR